MSTQPQSVWRRLSTSCLWQPLKLPGRTAPAEGAPAAVSRITLCLATVSSSKQFISHRLLLGLKCREQVEVRAPQSQQQKEWGKTTLCLTEALQSFTKLKTRTALALWDGQESGLRVCTDPRGQRRGPLCQPFSPATFATRDEVPDRAGRKFPRLLGGKGHLGL